MKRRPINRRPIWRRNRTFSMQTTARKMLARANRFMEQGNYYQAGEIFEKLANGSLRRQMLLRAPNLFLEAARAFFLAGEDQHGETLLKKGIKLLVETERWAILSQIQARIVIELREIGKTEYADEIQAWVSEQTAGKKFYPNQQTLKPKVHFPPKCPYCGGTVRPDEAEWASENAIICTYCGSTIQSLEN